MQGRSCARCAIFAAKSGSQPRHHQIPNSQWPCFKKTRLPSRKKWYSRTHTRTLKLFEMPVPVPCHSHPYTQESARETGQQKQEQAEKLFQAQLEVAVQRAKLEHLQNQAQSQVAVQNAATEELKKSQKVHTELLQKSNEAGMVHTKVVERLMQVYSPCHFCLCSFCSFLFTFTLDACAGPHGHSGEAV